VIGSISVFATLLPLIPSQLWWVRIFDFPRIQITALSIISIIAYFTIVNTFAVFDKILLGSLFLCIVYQSVKIFPYTFLSSKHVLESTKKVNDKNTFSLVITNVLMTNRESQKCLSVIQEADPDLVLAVETDKWWEKELMPLEKKYPYHSYAPLANTYGMLLYSKFKLVNCEIKYLLDHNIPSVHCVIELPSGEKIKFVGVHPKPPAPQESKTSIPRDAELIMVGKEAKASKLPVIVAGDLNDVAWSSTTHLFQKISGLLDPRVGRGLFPTYNAKHPLFRWPLDHVFHSNQFKLIELRRLEYIGSDHFPIFVKLSHEPEEAHTQPEPEPTESDLIDAKEKVKKAK
jgi:endonuclease/exonuclease/phosphatase (EEP) superfamily protein YafD